ncbi:hypothetical protein ACWKWU_08990 [Chitinophaga lutea]
MHASKIKLPDNPAPLASKEAPSDLAIPGSTPKLPAPEASEALVFMPDSLFQAYRGDHNLFVTNHYHVLYVKTDSVAPLTPVGPAIADHRIVARHLTRH